MSDSNVSHRQTQPLLTSIAVNDSNNNNTINNNNNTNNNNINSNSNLTSPRRHSIHPSHSNNANNSNNLLNIKTFFSQRRIILLSGIFIIFTFILYIIYFFGIFQSNNNTTIGTAQLQAKVETLLSRIVRLETKLLSMNNNHNNNQNNPNNNYDPIFSPQSILNHPSPLTLRTSSHLKHLSQSIYPRQAIFTLITLTSTYCHSVWTLYKSLRYTDPGHDWDFVVMFAESQDNSTFISDKYCANLYSFSYQALLNEKHSSNEESHHNHSSSLPSSGRIGHIRLMPVPTIENASWHTIPDRWRYSMNRLEMFHQLDYEHSIYIDADMIMVNSISSLFSLGYDLAGVVDQWDGCGRREVMNGGLLSFKPSIYLFESLKRIFYTEPSCISKTMVFSDQELINCLCGFAEATKPAVRDLSCGLFPSWAAMYPSDVKCPQFRKNDLIAIHFAFAPKPWDWHDDECIKSAQLEGNPLVREKQSLAMPQCHAIDEGKAFLSYWHCIDNGGSLTIDSERECKLTIVKDGKIDEQ